MEKIINENIQTLADCCKEYNKAIDSPGVWSAIYIDVSDNTIWAKSDINGDWPEYHSNTIYKLCDVPHHISEERLSAMAEKAFKHYQNVPHREGYMSEEFGEYLMYLNY